MKYHSNFVLIAALLISFLLAGCASMPRTQDIPVADAKHTIYFIYKGFHTSILLDANALVAQNPQLASDLAGQT